MASRSVRDGLPQLTLDAMGSAQVHPDQQRGAGVTVLVLLGAAALVAAAIGAVCVSHRRHLRRVDQEWERTEAPFWAALRDEADGCDEFPDEAEAA